MDLYTLTARRRKCMANTIKVCSEHLRCKERLDKANAKDVVVTGVSTDKRVEYQIALL
jgi:hypothetical protein